MQSITILPDEPIGTINPLLHGHFAEHLGELIYPGICVPPDSSIPNVGGIRSDVVAALKPLGIPVLRWPGGCFADTYHWRDGIGPVESRPTRVNVHWGMAEEPNRFGTHEFMAFCRAIAAEPYFAANLGSASPAENRDWVEYCNFSGNSALANERRANGAADPFHVRYWGIGNENWGCGGNMTPAEYAAAYSRHQTYLYNYPDSPVFKIACGPNAMDWAWTDRFFRAILDSSDNAQWRMNSIHAFAAHYYCGTAGTATEYDDAQWLELLAKAAAVDGIITGHRLIMDRYDPDRRIALLLDEWGTWHPVESGKPSGGLYQQSTIRDACVAALSLDLFHNHADMLMMANIAQLINVLQSLLLVEDDQCIATPTYHVFDLYRAHKGATAVRSIWDSDTLTDGGASAGHIRSCYHDAQPNHLRQVQGSVSLRDGTVCVTAVNSHPSESAEVAIESRGASLGNAIVTTLTADDIHAHNTFAHPTLVKPGSPVAVPSVAGALRLNLPPASISRITARIG